MQRFFNNLPQSVQYKTHAVSPMGIRARKQERVDVLMADMDMDIEDMDTILYSQQQLPSATNVTFMLLFKE